MLEKILQESPEPRWFVDLQLAVSLCLGGEIMSERRNQGKFQT